MREIVFDTETTGFEPGDGHRIVEIGCVELMDHFPTGRTLQFYLNPERDVPIESQRVLARPGMTEEKFQALLKRQMSDAEKRAQAHYLVVTDKGLDHARDQVKMILADVRAKMNA